MNPNQADWQDSGEGSQTTITLHCSNDGEIRMDSGSYSFEGTAQEAGEEFKKLLQHGQERRQP